MMKGAHLTTPVGLATGCVIEGRFTIILERLDKVGRQFMGQARNLGHSHPIAAVGGATTSDGNSLLSGAAYRKALYR